MTGISGGVGVPRKSFSRTQAIVAGGLIDSDHDHQPTRTYIIIIALRLEIHATMKVTTVHVEEKKNTRIGGN